MAQRIRRRRAAQLSVRRLNVNQTGFIVRVAEAEHMVAALREKYHPVAKLGVPAHVTVLFPFMALEDIDNSVEQKIQAALVCVAAFSFNLSSVGRFPVTAYLVPEPKQPFVALTHALYRAFPSFPPFGGEFEDIIPHLTVAHGAAEQAEEAAVEMGLALAASGPVHSHCKEVELLENSSGMWPTARVFPLHESQCAA